MPSPLVPGRRLPVVSLLAVIFVAAGWLLVSTQLLAQEPTARPRSLRDGYPEPQPDLSLPIGTPNPPFIGKAPEGALVVNRTGTYGGVLINSEPGEVENFNPVEPKGATSQEMLALLFSGLVKYQNGAWDFAPALAESFEVKDDQRTWIFTLRKGVLWNDGTPLTSADVVFSFDAVLHPKVANSLQDILKDSQGRLPSYRALDERRVEFVSPEVDATFLMKIGIVYIFPRHKWADCLDPENPTILEQMTNATPAKDIVGTGPFRLKEYVPAEKVVLERNPYYWKVDARGQRLPYVDTYVVELLADMNLQYQRFEAGEHHLLEDLAVDHFKEARALDERDPSVELVRLGPNVNSYWLALNQHPGANPDTGEPFVSPEKLHWFQNLDFRRAMNHAVDRAGIVKTALQGRGQVIWSQVTPGNRAWFHPEVKKYPFDAKLAGEILDGLGWTDRDGDGVREDDKGRKISFELNTNVENKVREQMGTLIQNYLRQVGVEVLFKPLAFNDLITSMQDSHRWDAIILGWASGVPPDPSLMKNILLSSGRLHVWYPQQEKPATEWERRVDELCDHMSREFDEDKRKQMSDELQDLHAAHIPVFYLVAPNAYAMARNKVGNLWPSVLRPQLTWNIDELFLKAPR